MSKTRNQRRERRRAWNAAAGGLTVFILMAAGLPAWLSALEAAVW